MGSARKPLILRFDDQFEVQGVNGAPFSLGGDSGSAIVDEANNVRGLLFAGGPDEDGLELTFANQMVNLLAELGVQLAT